MNRVRLSVMVGLFSCWTAGCLAVSPAPRLDQYLGATAQTPADSSQVRQLQGAPLHAGLIVIHDAAGNRADAATLQHSKLFLTDQTRKMAESRLSIRIASVLDSPTENAAQALDAWRTQAQGQQLSHVLVALFSNDQTDTPDTLPLDGTQQGGGAMGRVLGITTTNFALAELAVLSFNDKGREVLARAEGRDWATLERLDNNMESNAFPSIRRSGRLARIVPPADEARAKDMLRGIASADALEQAMARLEVQWKSGGAR